MKTYLLLLFIACQGVTVLAQNSGKTPYQTKSLAGDAIKEVFVKNIWRKYYG